MGQQIQSALELIQQGKTLDDYHHACQVFTDETGFADYTLRRAQCTERAARWLPHYQRRRERGERAR